MAAWAAWEMGQVICRIARVHARRRREPQASGDHVLSARTASIMEVEPTAPTMQVLSRHSGREYEAGLRRDEREGGAADDEAALAQCEIKWYLP